MIGVNAAKLAPDDVSHFSLASLRAPALISETVQSPMVQPPPQNTEGFAPVAGIMVTRACFFFKSSFIAHTSIYIGTSILVGQQSVSISPPKLIPCATSGTEAVHAELGPTTIRY